MKIEMTLIGRFICSFDLPKDRYLLEKLVIHPASPGELAPPKPKLKARHFNAGNGQKNGREREMTRKRRIQRASK